MLTRTARALGLGLVALATACGGADSHDAVPIAMHLTLPGHLPVQSLTLTVFGQNGTCAPDGLASGDALPDLSDVALPIGQATTLRVSAGRRTFFVEAWDASDARVARGCETLVLDPGSENHVAITLVEEPAPPDAGPSDAPPVDAGVPDAAPIDAMPVEGDDCASLIAIAPGVTTGDTTGARDDFTATCGGSGGGDLGFTFTLAMDARVRVTATATGGAIDPVVSIRSTCGAAASELSCDAAPDVASIDLRTLGAGTYTVLVDSDSGPGAFDLELEILPIPPVDDLCGGATPLVEGMISSGTTVAADDDTTGTCSLGGSEVFYSFSLATPRRVVLSLTASTVEHAVYVQSTCGAPATEVDCVATPAPDETLDILNLAAGSYTVVVESEAAGGGTFDLLLETFPPVPNDTCATPTVLADPSLLVGNSSVGANDDEDGTCAGAGFTPDIVYQYTLSEARHVTLDVTTDYDAAISIRSPTCVDEPSELQCRNATAGPGTETIDIRSQPAGTYYVVVDGVGGATGSATIDFSTTPPPPPGDSCAEVQTLPTGTTTGQSLSSSYVDDTSGTCGGAGADRVYTFAITGNKHVNLATQATFAHRMYVRSTSCTSGSEAGCVASTPGGGFEQSTLDFPNLAGGTYFVFIDAATAGASGTFDITLTVTAPALPPPNDTCALATPLADGLAQVGTLDNANHEVDPTCGGTGNDDVFYTFTLSTARYVNITLTSAFDTSLTLRGGTCASPTEIECQNATTLGEQIVEENLAAGTYTIVVEGIGGATGTFSIGFTTGAPIVRPPNDQCAGAIGLTSGVARTGDNVLSALDDADGTCGSTTGVDVVYSFSIPGPSNQRARITVSNAVGFDPVVYLRSASCSGSQVSCSQASLGATEVVDARDLAPGTYYVWVDTMAAPVAPATFDILLELLPVPPSNDLCSGSTTLIAGMMVSGTTAASDDNTTGSCSAGGREVFYGFTLATPRRVVLSLTGASTEHAIYLQGTCGASATQIDCESTISLDETLEILSLAAGSYTVVVEAEGGAGGPFNLQLDTYAPVPNDTCSSPTVLTDPIVLTGQSSVGATDNELGSCSGGGSTPDIIYQYTLSEARHVTIDVTSDYDAAVSIRSPTCVDEPSELQCVNGVAGAGTETIDIRSQPAGTYYVVVDGVAGGTGTATVDFSTTPPPPAGDSCAEVQTLPTGTSTAQSLSASYVDDTSGSCGGAGRDRVYTFTIVGSRHVNIATQATFSHRMYLRATSCTAGSEQSCVGSSFMAGSHQSTIDIPNLAGGTYFVFVDADAATATGTFDITLTVTAPTSPPSNDACSGATLLAEGLAIPGTLDGATNDTGVTCVGGTNNDVFYTFTLATNRYVTITLTSGFDTSMTLRSGTCAAPTEIQCRNATTTGEQIVQENLAAGTYTVVVEGVGGATGSFTIGYTTAAPIVRPPNDQCSGKITLVSGVPRVGDNLNNALDDADGSCGDLTSGDAVYTFTIPGPSNQRARVRVTNANGFDPVVYLQGSVCGGSELACAQTSTGNSETLDEPNLSPGTYHVWVDAMGGVVAPATYDVQLDLLTAVLPPSNDVCAGADALVAGTAETWSTIGATDDYSLSCLTFDSRDAVHSFDTTALGARAVLVTADALAPPWDLAVALRNAAECTGTSDLSCVADGFSTRYINRPNLAGGSYRVIVDGESGASGDYSIRYDVRAADTSFGYWVIDTTGTYAPVTGGTAISIPVTNWGVDSGTGPGDEWTRTITLPFTFSYFGAAYTQLTATSNGYVAFGSAGSGTESYVNDCPLSNSIPNDMIALFWDDGISRTAYPSELLTKTEGVAPSRRFIVEFKDFDLLSCGATTCYLMDVRMNQQLILHENGDIEMRYGPRQAPGFARNCTGGNGGSTTTHHLGFCATLGIEGQVSGSTDVDQVQCNTTTPSVTDGRVLYFVHPR